MKTFLYFAYGSNMLPARLGDRCPSAKLIGVGIAPNFRFEFSKASIDGSGKATLVPSLAEQVPGAIFEIQTTEREALDRHEGMGVGYQREDAFKVTPVFGGVSLLTSTYLATALAPDLQPFDWYLAAVIAGAEHHRMDVKHIDALRSTRCITDPDVNRLTRTAAIKALSDHGVRDFRTLLKGSV